MGVAIVIPLGAASVTAGEVLAASAVATAVVAGGAVVANAVENNRGRGGRRRGPRYRCRQCGGIHGGCYGDLCPFCYFKRNGTYKQ
mmetsp:Transcript_68652/g.61674  ORF Transcript_68652/g.61674 Transcript_68652/m.61674 type:complete len:86 (-) Transcript_68652:83-340(-)